MKQVACCHRPAQLASRCTPRLPQSRNSRLHIAAVLQEDPPSQTTSAKGSESLGFQQQQLAIVEQQLNRLLAPSLAGRERRPPQQLSAAADQVLYFAYGANLSFETLRKRDCRIEQRYSAFVVDPQIKLVFQHRGGYSTLQRLPEDRQPKYRSFLSNVHGVLYQVNKDDMRKLQKREGGYVLTEIEVETYDGFRATAKAFVSGSLALLTSEVVPTERYMMVLRDGAAEQYLDPLWQAWLSSIETRPSAGLGMEYYDTPAKFLAYGFLAIVALVVVGFFAQH